MKGERCGCGYIGWFLILFGTLNWGLVGLGGFFGGDWNAVDILFGNVAWLENLVYLLIGLSGLWLFFGGCKCKKCSVGIPKSGGNMGGQQM